MKNYDTIPNTTGAFPNVVGQNATGPGATDGTSFIKQFVDDYFGARQAVMDEAGLSPNGNQEAAGASQLLDALEIIVGLNVYQSDILVKNWFTNTTAFGGKRNCNYALGYWLAVGTVAGPELEFSPNGDIWRLVSVPSAEQLYDVAGNDADTIAVAVGANGTIAHGTDVRIAWVNNDHGADDYLCVDFGNGVWCAGTDNGDVYTATDPTGLWTLRPTPASSGNESLRDMRYIDELSLWVSVGEKSGGFSGIITATDPTGTWDERTNPLAGTPQLYHVEYDGTNVVAGGGVDPGTGSLIVSANGISWADKSSSLPYGATKYVRSLAADPLGRIVMQQEVGVAADPESLFVSKDGADNWFGVYSVALSGSEQGAAYSDAARGFLFVDGAFATRSIRI